MAYLGPIEDAERYYPAMSEWLETFLRNWQRAWAV